LIVLSVGYVVAEVDYLRCLVGAGTEGWGQAKSPKGLKRRDGGGWWSKGSEKERKKASVLYIPTIRGVFGRGQIKRAQDGQSPRIWGQRQLSRHVAKLTTLEQV
jgi:hypothetical protein